MYFVIVWCGLFNPAEYLDFIFLQHEMTAVEKPYDLHKEFNLCGLSRKCSSWKSNMAGRFPLEAICSWGLMKVTGLNQGDIILFFLKSYLVKWDQSFSHLCNCRDTVLHVLCTLSYYIMIWLIIWYNGCRFDPWVRKIPGGGNDNPLLYSCLGNLLDRGAW